MNARLKIVVATPFFPIRAEPYRGSPIYQTVLALQRWADVEVLCPAATFPRWKILHPRKFRYRPPDPDYSPPGVRTKYIAYPALPWLSRPFNGWICARSLHSSLKESRPDLVLAYWIYPEGYGALTVARKLGIPAVLGARGSDLARIDDPFTHFWTRLALQRAAHVITVSEDLRRRALALGASPERTRTISNGCDRSVFRLDDRAVARTELGVASDEQLVLFVGRLEDRKGVADLLEALARLIPAHPNLQLACIGETPQAGNPFQARAAGPELQGHVRFLGPQTPQQVSRWLAASNLLCLPSYSEGCPNVVVEALSCGRPVVASDVGGIPELVGTTSGILLPPRSPDRLAEALAEAFRRPWDEPGIAAQFGRSWDQVAEETYQTCLGVHEAARRRI